METLIIELCTKVVDLLQVIVDTVVKVAGIFATFSL